MGTLRLLLALLVATSHLASVVEDIPEILCGQAAIAVRLFFVLSGFYMALVLQAPRSRYRRATDFYMSRLLKLLPMYWVLSAITFAIAASTRGDFFPLLNPFQAWHRIDMSTIPGGALAYIATTLISLIGSDTWTWLGVNPSSGAWSIAPAYASGATSALVLSAVPQAWTLGLELGFYALAPLLARTRTVWLLVIIGASIGLRFAFAPGPPFDRSLLVLELPFFLSGMIAYRVVSSLAAFATRTGRIDAALGALSYPAYISHLLVFAVLYQSSALTMPWWTTLPLALACVIALSIALDLLIAKPIDSLRVRFGARLRSLQNLPARVMPAE
jgi:peptidoglycan/LPS O-acetylase OafA/YrhL